MTNSASPPAIRLRGVRQNNLKNFDLDVRLGRLSVVTGLSGSGKSSLAFDTLFAEGQRRYIETFSPYARQFFDRMDKPQVDRIEGIPPAIAVEQRNTVRTTRSTVGTMTEVCDYLKLLWPHLARLHCVQCGQPVRREPPQVVWTALLALPETRGAEVLITFDLPLSAKLSLGESLELIAKQGYQRLLAGPELVRVEEAAGHPALARPSGALTILQDRLALTEGNRARFVEACEQAYHFGKGKIAVRLLARGASPPLAGARVLPFSHGFHCATCDRDYREPTSALFSFNHPLGACPACKGFGRIITIDYDLALPDPTRTLAEGCVRPWQTGHGLESQHDLMKFCRAMKIPTDVPFAQLPQKTRDWVINGDPDYGIDEDHQWPRLWYGVKGYFRWLESKSYKMHVRVLLSRYRAYTSCPDCRGQRFQPESLLYKISVPDSNGAAPLSLAGFYALPSQTALQVIDQVSATRELRAAANDPVGLALGEVRSRLSYLVEVGLGYLTLDRPMRTLSGGETERVNLTTCLGSRLCHTLFVLDEPSVGLHPRDTAQLVQILHKLRDTGNTVVVVEHDAAIMRAADAIIDLGPGQGEKGGQVVFHGPVAELLVHPASLTGQYLSGRRQIEIPMRRLVSPGSSPPNPRFPAARAESAALELNEAVATFGHNSAQALIVRHASRHNLSDLSVTIPLHRLVCLTGVSGSGKTTLLREVLLPALTRRLGAVDSQTAKASDRLGKDKDLEESDGGDEAKDGTRSSQVDGWEALTQVVLVDQSPLGKTPRSNPVVYIGAFDDLRELFAQTPLAKERELSGSAFSFNSAVGQCERCRGAGFEKIEMQFLSDIFIRCSECHGRRYRGHILEVRLSAPAADGAKGTAPSWSIADLLEATVDDAVSFLDAFAQVPAASRASGRLRLLQEVGLGYLRLGQPINTLSGGESQRLKLISHLAEAGVSARNASPAAPTAAGRTRLGRTPSKAAEARPPSILFLFDEPTTGLHFEDVRVLLQVFQRLVDAGHSLVVIEHNLDVIKCADWVIDLGPEAGAGGGRIVAQGTPETIAACATSHTGRFLRQVLPASVSARSPSPRRPRAVPA
jgi:excinuclease ABC subunit A